MCVITASKRVNYAAHELTLPPRVAAGVYFPISSPSTPSCGPGSAEECTSARKGPPNQTLVIKFNMVRHVLTSSRHEDLGCGALCRILPRHGLLPGPCPVWENPRVCMHRYGALEWAGAPRTGAWGAYSYVWKVCVTLGVCAVCVCVSCALPMSYTVGPGARKACVGYLVPVRGAWGAPCGFSWVWCGVPRPSG